MWFLGKIRENCESLPTDFSRTAGLHDEVLAKTSLSAKLPCNVLTPDKIPDFFIPPRLSRNARAVNIVTNKPRCHHSASQVSNLRQLQTDAHRLLARGGTVTDEPTHRVVEVDFVCHGDEALGGPTKGRALNGIKTSKQLQHTREFYGLSGLYESPNTRRKESLFHSGLTSYFLERKLYGFPYRQRAVSICKPLSEQDSTESDTPSSSDCSPRGSPVPPRSQSSSIFSKLLGQDLGVARCTSSGPEQNLRLNEVESHTPCSPSPGALLSPPVLHPLDMLHCQERLQREHVLPLLGRGRVRLSVELDPAGSALRVRVVSVEDLHDTAHGGRLAHCCISLCLTPGKHQRQTSATIRNCRNPIFNEDFFFTGLTEDSFHNLCLRLKVLDKASSLKRDVVLGVVSEPLSQLLPL